MIDINETLWPVVIFKWPGIVADDDLESYLAYGACLLADGQPYVAVIDLNLSSNLSSRQIKRFFQKQNEWIQTHEAALKTTCLGMIFLVNSLARQAAVNAHLRLRPTPFPVWVVENNRQAEAWVTDQLKTIHAMAAAPTAIT